MKFKNGDKVKVIRHPNTCGGCSGSECRFFGLTGIVTNYNYRITPEGIRVHVMFPDKRNCSGFLERDLELVSNKTIKKYGIALFMESLNNK
jgi:hypothetical protein